MTTNSATAPAPTRAAKGTSDKRRQRARAAAKPVVFIDGEAGTTGLEIRSRLADVASVVVHSIDAAKRKDKALRLAMMRQADLVVLCLPDAAAVEAVAMLDAAGPNGPKLIDASTAHRTVEGWVYGFSEMDQGQAAAIAAARRVTNPGCYPTAAIALIRPLVARGLIPPDYPLTINAVSGYSGGGRSMIEAFERRSAPSFELYGLNLAHKHVPELQMYAQLTRRPIFVPSVANFRRGMLVSVPLHLDTLPGKPSAGDLIVALSAHYRGAKLVKVVPAGDPASKDWRLEPEGLNASDALELRVCASAEHAQAVLVARLDNLGKGACGAAVQNIGLMLGVAS
jgi:N-acetyl-gamma-glutamyl-phosphate reductase